MIKKLAILFILFLLIYFLVSLPQSLDQKNSNIRIGTVNYLFSNTSFEEFKDVIAESNIDALLVLEYRQELESILLNLGYTNLNSYDNKGTHGIALFIKSKHRGSAKIFYPPKVSRCTMPYIFAELDIDNEKIPILGVHLPPPLIQCGSKTAESFESIYSLIKEYKMSDRIR